MGCNNCVPVSIYKTGLCFLITGFLSSVVTIYLLVSADYKEYAKIQQSKQVTEEVRKSACILR